ncbi:MAG: hypothetical protein B7X90_13910 [Novosphingobium sp. 17-62-19]|nr:MAG: hypothetical protein B7X90_13910 [Novosphingobium sp. 17-62-19]OZA55610.1 MAG: hypothetical protein B7X78_10555 [Sphingomonadales bacterium 39-62-4]
MPPDIVIILTLGGTNDLRTILYCAAQNLSKSDIFHAYFNDWTLQPIFCCIDVAMFNFAFFRRILQSTGMAGF